MSGFLQSAGDISKEGLGTILNIADMALAARSGQLGSHLIQRQAALQDPRFRQSIADSPFMAGFLGQYGHRQPSSSPDELQRANVIPGVNIPPDVQVLGSGEAPGQSQFQTNLPPLSPDVQLGELLKRYQVAGAAGQAAMLPLRQQLLEGQVQNIGLANKYLGEDATPGAVAPSTPSAAAGAPAVSPAATASTSTANPLAAAESIVYPDRARGIGPTAPAAASATPRGLVRKGASIDSSGKLSVQLGAPTGEIIKAGTQGVNGPLTPGMDLGGGKFVAGVTEDPATLQARTALTKAHEESVRNANSVLEIIPALRKKADQFLYDASTREGNALGTLGAGTYNYLAKIKQESPYGLPLTMASGAGAEFRTAVNKVIPLIRAAGEGTSGLRVTNTEFERQGGPFTHPENYSRQDFLAYLDQIEADMKQITKPARRLGSR